mmetsp:Transcript_25444/g.37507  ORF Transcript_25444/g.37507 Transcript_25444/m.37507 type:complete len:1122 (+) Transcript_25444:90-3455(+)
MTETIKEIKDKLISLGVDTTTPGLKGEQRREELINRLEEALLHQDESVSHENNDELESIVTTKFSVPSMADLSMAELRSRLAILGESTSTPGLSGEKRRAELMKRMVNAICRNEDSGDSMIDDIVQSMEYGSPSKSDVVDGSSPRSAEGTIENTDSAVEDAPGETLNDRLSRMRQLEKKKLSELGEAKKRLNALVNKRAMVISGRFSGPMQDERLRDTTKLLTDTESEISRISGLKKRMAKQGGGKAMVSSPVIENGSTMTADKLLVKLETSRHSAKEKVKWHKSRIRCEEEGNEYYGAEAEEIEQARVQELSYSISKIKRDMEKLAAGMHVDDIQEEDEVEKRSSTHSPAAASATDVPDGLFQKQRENSQEDEPHAKQQKKAPDEAKVQKTQKASGSGQYLTADLDLDAFKPFQPYKEEEEDDVLKLKMEMLRNRHKAVKEQASGMMAAKLALSAERTSSIKEENKRNENDTPAVSEPKVESKDHTTPEPKCSILSGSTAFSAFSRPNPNRTVRHQTSPPPIKQMQETVNANDCLLDDNTGAMGSSYHHEDEAAKGLYKKADSPPSGTDVTAGNSNEGNSTNANAAEPTEAKDSTCASENEYVRTPPKAQTVGILQEGSDSESSTGEDEDEEEAAEQTKALRDHARVLERKGDNDAVEELYVRALSLSPTDVRTLDAFATFLHRRKGEMGRAEAFYRRAIQVSIPSMVADISSPRVGYKAAIDSPIDKPTDVPGDPPSGGVRVKSLTTMLLHFAAFLRRAKGDLAVAETVLRKAVEISPNDAVVLGTCAHLLAEEADESGSDVAVKNKQDAAEIFQRAMKADPSNVNNMLWYAKFLRKTGKIAQAEVMFKVAIQKSNGEGKVGATAICNYAVFLYRQKHRPEEAAALFCHGIEKFPSHKGMIKNYKALKKDLERATATLKPSDRGRPEAPPLPPPSENGTESAGPDSGGKDSSRRGGVKERLYTMISESEFDSCVEISLLQVTCSELTTDIGNCEVYWTVLWGSGDDQFYRSCSKSVCDSDKSVLWTLSSRYNIDSDTDNSPSIVVALDDHLCFELYTTNDDGVVDGKFIGSVIYPIEDMMHSSDIVRNDMYYIEETIMSDDDNVMGQFQAQLKFSRHSS